MTATAATFAVCAGVAWAVAAAYLGALLGELAYHLRHR